MGDEIDEKLIGLTKYIPFIDFALNIDKEKYRKFQNIKDWIIHKKRFSLDNLIEIEKAITCQYRKLLLYKDLEIPIEVKHIFDKKIIYEYVDLCSDDEIESDGIENVNDFLFSLIKSELDSEEIEEKMETVPQSESIPLRMDLDETSIINLKDVKFDVLNFNGDNEKKLFKRRSDLLIKEATIKKKRLPSLSSMETLSSISSAKSEAERAIEIIEGKLNEPTARKFAINRESNNESNRPGSPVCFANVWKTLGNKDKNNLKIVFENVQSQEKSKVVDDKPGRQAIPNQATRINDERRFFNQQAFPEQQVRSSVVFDQSPQSFANNNNQLAAYPVNVSNPYQPIYAFDPYAPANRNSCLNDNRFFSTPLAVPNPLIRNSIGAAPHCPIYISNHYPLPSIYTNGPGPGWCTPLQSMSPFNPGDIADSQFRMPYAQTPMQRCNYARNCACPTQQSVPLNVSRQPSSAKNFMVRSAHSNNPEIYEQHKKSGKLVEEWQQKYQVNEKRHKMEKTVQEVEFTREMKDRKLERTHKKMNDTQQQTEAEKPIKATVDAIERNTGELKTKENKKNEAQQTQLKDLVTAKETGKLESKKNESKKPEEQQQVEAQRQTREVTTVEQSERPEFKKKEAAQRQMEARKRNIEPAYGKETEELESKKKRSQKNKAQQCIEVERQIKKSIAVKCTEYQELRKKGIKKNKAQQQTKAKIQTIKAVNAKDAKKFESKNKEKQKKKEGKAASDAKDREKLELKEKQSQKYDVHLHPKAIKQTEGVANSWKIEAEKKIQETGSVKQRQKIDSRKKENKKGEKQVQMQVSFFQNNKNEKLSKIPKVTQKLISDDENKNSTIDREKDRGMFTQTQHPGVSGKKNVDKEFKKLESNKKEQRQKERYPPKTSNGQASTISPCQLNNSSSSNDNGKGKKGKKASKCLTEDESFDSQASTSSVLRKMKRTCDDVINNQSSLLPSPDRLNEEESLSAEEEAFHAYLAEERSEITKVQHNEIYTTKITKHKKRNNNHKMTEKNTTFCVLCKSRPNDLVNHYIRKHRTESYVSRLTKAELRGLITNTNFADPQKFSNQSIERYTVICPFCQYDVTEPFLRLYNHFSKHTGEYAYICTCCLLSKPFRADIDSHQRHAKNCRNANISILYRYPQDATVIYLYYCSLCNYVQLNEANIAQHLRDQHNPHEAVQTNVKKCILAAIREAPRTQLEESFPKSKTIESHLNEDRNESLSENLNYLNKKEKLDVRNEPCVETSGKDEFPIFEIPWPVDAKRMIPIKCEEIDISERSFETQTLSLTSLRYSPLKSFLNQTNNESQYDELEKNEFSLTEIGDRAVEDMSCSNEACTKDFDVGNKRIGLKIAQVHCSIKENELTPIKCEAIDISENDSPSTPLFPSSSAISVQFEPWPKQVVAEAAFKYRSIPANERYLGLYKCIYNNCYFSTDEKDAILSHLKYHADSGCPPKEYLQCAYCTPLNKCNTAQELVEHIQLKHQHNIYQCSLCSYRSSSSSNVTVHQQLEHSTIRQNHIIYKCGNQENTYQQEKQYLATKKVQHVQKISCPYCTESFYGSIHLKRHVNDAHQVYSFNLNDLKTYSCIYCETSGTDQKNIQIHLAVNHPDELPFMCNHNATEDAKLDCVESLKLINVSDTISSSLVKDISNQRFGAKDFDEKELRPLDVKRDLEARNENTAIAHLRKLTESTDVPLVRLFRCPESTCGSCFPSYEAWFQHMKACHHSLFYYCPHCPSINRDRELLDLENFKTHFEEHSRHNYICFDCLNTFNCGKVLRIHALTTHHFNEWRLEEIHDNSCGCYYVLIRKNLYKDRLVFLTKFVEMLDNQLRKLGDNNKLQSGWLVPKATAWLENFPVSISGRKNSKKCLYSECDFLTTEDDEWVKHVGNEHEIDGRGFLCSQCAFEIPRCESWEPVFEHLKDHSNCYLYVCCVCSSHHSYRSKLRAHIEQDHDAQDVPFVQLIKKDKNVFIEVGFGFARGARCFSTIYDCFCCEKHDMVRQDEFGLHLKNYHKLTLTYYCEFCHKYLDNPQSCDHHLKAKHSLAQTKIYCKLAFKGNVTVKSVQPFELQVGNCAEIKVETTTPL
uniref:C2H2-type domain-containing protein n=1 Tax=Glossina pallidipes TaxID=7398 RepID=A0A1A9ZJA2_GLOPL